MLRARVGELPDSAALAREAAAMEERLRQLRVAVQLEQHRRASIPRDKDGTVWQSARPVADRSYLDAVMKRVKAKEQEMRNRRRASRVRATSQAPSQQQQQQTQQQAQQPPLVPRPPPCPEAPRARPPSAAGYSPPLARSESKLDVKVSARGADEDVPSTEDAESDADWFKRARAEFIASLAVDGGARVTSPLPLLQRARRDVLSHCDAGAEGGDSDSKGNADDEDAAGHAAFLSAREAFLASLKEPALERAPSPSPSPVANTGASLLDGHFDEEESTRAFQEARREFLAGPSQQQQPAHQVPRPPSEWRAADEPQALAFLLADGSSRPGSAKPQAAKKQPPAARFSCYHCFRVGARPDAVAGADASRLYCSQNCRTVAEELEAREGRERQAALAAARDAALRLAEPQFAEHTVDRAPTPHTQPFIAPVESASRPASVAAAPRRTVVQPSGAIVEFPPEDDENDDAEQVLVAAHAPPPRPIVTFPDDEDGDGSGELADA